MAIMSQSAVLQPPAGKITVPSISKTEPAHGAVFESFPATQKTLRSEEGTILRCGDMCANNLI